MWFVIVYGAGVPLHPLQPILSPLCCIIGVKIISKNKTGNIEKEWKILLLGGFIGSILNGISSSFIYNNGVITSSMYGYICWRYVRPNHFNGHASIYVQVFENI